MKTPRFLNACISFRRRLVGGAEGKEEKEAGADLGCVLGGGCLTLPPPSAISPG